MTRGSGSGLSPRPAFPRLVAQPGPWDLFSVPVAFPASSSHAASSPTAVSGVARSSPLSIPARPPLPVPSVGSPARRGSASTHRPPRRGGARHLGLSGGSCEMSANILCGLLQQASWCRCWRASGNRSPAVTNGSGTAAAVPTRVPPVGWATPRHRRPRRDMELGWEGGDPSGERCTASTRCHQRIAAAVLIFLGAGGPWVGRIPRLGRVNGTVSVSGAFCFFPFFFVFSLPLPIFNEGLAQL